MSEAQDVFAAVLAKCGALQSELEQKVDANLSGDVLQSRSGRLRASIHAALQSGGSSVTVSLGSVGVPYAAIQEFGGETSAHDIVATKAQALRFVAAGRAVFARQIHHPGSRIPARSYLGSALDSLRAEIEGDLKAAVLDALDAS